MIISDDTLIKVKNLQSLVDNIKWLNVFDDATFLNWFYAQLFYKYRDVFQFYSLVDSWDGYINNRKRNYQRHEQCIELLEEYFPYTMPSIVDKLVDEETRQLVHETLIRVSDRTKQLIGLANVPESNKTQEKGKIDDLIRNQYFGVMLPKLEPGDKLKPILQDFNENDTIISYILKGDLFNKNQVRNGNHGHCALRK